MQELTATKKLKLNFLKFQIPLILTYFHISAIGSPCHPSTLLDSLLLTTARFEDRSHVWTVDQSKIHPGSHNLLRFNNFSVLVQKLKAFFQLTKVITLPITTTSSQHDERNKLSLFQVKTTKSKFIYLRYNRYVF